MEHVQYCVYICTCALGSKRDATRQEKSVDAGIDSGNLQALPGRPVHCRPAVAPHVRNRNWSRVQVWTWRSKHEEEALQAVSKAPDAHGWLEPQAVLLDMRGNSRNAFMDR
jgi:hypothetical protein